MATATISLATLRKELAEIFEARAVALAKEGLKHSNDRNAQLAELHAFVASEFKYIADLIREGLPQK